MIPSRFIGYRVSEKEQERRQHQSKLGRSYESKNCRVENTSSLPVTAGSQCATWDNTDISEPLDKCGAFNCRAFKYTSGSVRCGTQLKLLISSFYGLWLFLWLESSESLPRLFLLTAVNIIDVQKQKRLCKRHFVLPALYEVERPG